MTNNLSKRRGAYLYSCRGPRGLVYQWNLGSRAGVKQFGARMQVEAKTGDFLGNVGLVGGLHIMEEARGSINDVCGALFDGLRYIGDVSYAILPRDVAHSLGDLKKSFWSNVRLAIDKEVEWIDERVTGGDRLREEWRQKCRREKEARATDNPLNDF